MNLSREVSSPDTDTSTVGSSSVTNLIQETANGHGSLHRRRQSLTSSDDEILRANETQCGGNNGAGCCSSVSAVRTVVDIEDLTTQRSINNDIEK